MRLVMIDFIHQLYNCMHINFSNVPKISNICISFNFLMARFYHKAKESRGKTRIDQKFAMFCLYFRLKCEAILEKFLFIQFSKFLICSSSSKCRHDADTKYQKAKHNIHSRAIFSNCGANGSGALT